MRDARTGETLWKHSIAIDVQNGGMAADIDPRHHGFEAWGGPGGLRDSNGDEMGPCPSSKDFVIWWDGDLLRELLAGATIYKWNWKKGRQEMLFSAYPQMRGRGSNTMEDPSGDWHDELLVGSAIYSRRWEQVSRSPRERILATRRWRGVYRPNLMGDFVGDWREELLVPSPDGESLRLYTTTIPTQHRIYTLMHDPQYRLSIAWQNVVYNKPPHTSFFLGDGMKAPPKPNIYLVGNGEGLTLK